MNPLADGRQWIVITGDNREILPTLDQVDHVITDPPYEAEAHTKQRRGRRGNGSLSFESLSFESRAEAGREIARVCKRWAVVFCQCEASQLWRAALEPLVYKRTGVWIKPDGMPQYTGDRPGMGYESIVFAHRKGRSRWNGGGRHGVFTHCKRNCEDPDGKGWHETQKPIRLMLELVELFTDPGDLVLDPFCGSGTTGVACLRLGRRFVGIERDQNWAELARERLKAEASGNDLVSQRSGQEALFR